MWPACLYIFSRKNTLRASRAESMSEKPINHFRYSLLTIKELKSFKALRQRNKNILRISEVINEVYLQLSKSLLK